MKNGKKPTVKQMKRISELGLKATSWLVVKDCKDEFVLISRNKGVVRTFNKEISSP